MMDSSRQETEGRGHEADCAVQGCESDTTVDDATVTRHQVSSASHSHEIQNTRDRLREPVATDTTVGNEYDRCTNYGRDNVLQTTIGSTTENRNGHLEPNGALRIGTISENNRSTQACIQKFRVKSIVQRFQENPWYEGVQVRARMWSEENDEASARGANYEECKKSKNAR